MPARQGARESGAVVASRHTLQLAVVGGVEKHPSIPSAQNHVPERDITDAGQDNHVRRKRTAVQNGASRGPVGAALNHHGHPRNALVGAGDRCCSSRVASGVHVNHMVGMEVVGIEYPLDRILGRGRGEPVVRGGANTGAIHIANGIRIIHVVRNRSNSLQGKGLIVLVPRIGLSFTNNPPVHKGGGGDGEGVPQIVVIGDGQTRGNRQPCRAHVC